MKIRLGLVAALAALCSFGSAQAATYDYTVSFDIGTDQVTGSIITTCQNCALLGNVSSYLFTDTNGNTVSSVGSIHTPLDFTADPLYVTTTAITDTAPSSGTDAFEFFGTSASNNSIEFYNYSAAYEQSNGKGDNPLLTAAFIGNPYGTVSSSTIATLAATPLPAALPLFAGGLGLIGLLSRRRKRKGQNALALA